MEVKEILNKNLEVYSLNAAAKKLGVSSKFLKKGIEDGSLKYVKNGNVTYISNFALAKFFESCNEYV